MPQFLQPKKSSQHRVAAFALYRALLSRCSSAPLPIDDRTSLHNAIRNKFRRNRKIANIYQLGLVFRAGYETLKHLDASIGGNAASVSSLTSLVSSLPQGIKRAPRRLPTLSSPDPSKEQVAVLPPKTSVLQVRPYAKVSGPRHVPILAQVQGIPFLRLKKPQPEALSRALQHKLQKRIDLFDERVLLNNYWLPCARQEDIWDEIIREELGTGEDESGEDGTRWTDMVGEALNINVAAHDKELAEDKRNIRIMSKIVAEETQLAEQEGQKVVRGRQGKTIKSHWLT